MVRADRQPAAFTKATRGSAASDLIFRKLTRLLAPVLLITLVALPACGPAAPTGDDTSPAAAPDNTPYTLIAPPDANDPMATHIYELANGLTVYLSENREEPRFYAEIAVRAGSKHDPADATGLAHYLEHLLFKGTQQMGTLDYEAEKPHLERITELYESHFRETDPVRRDAIYAEINAESREAARYAVANEIDKIYNAMGASGLNAHTWHEETVYRVALPSNRLEHWAALESHRFREPVFRLFHTELEVVYEEKNRTLDNRARVSSYALSDLLYPTHPYGQQPTIGHAEHLRNPSLVYIQEYFDTWYVPNNMAVMISGDIDIEQTIQTIAEHFGDWEPAPLPEVGPWQEDDISGVQSRTVYYPGQEEVRLAFRTVLHGHPDHDALSVLDMILDNRTAGLINLNLNQRQLVQGAGASPEFLNDYGSQRLWGSPRTGQSLEEVEQLLLDQLALVRNGEFEEWLLEAIINDFRSMEKRALESNTARASRMRQAFLTFSDWQYQVARMDRMEQLTRQDIIDVAQRYFSDENYVVVYRRNGPADIPEVEKPQIDPVEIDPTRQSEFATALLAMPVEPIEPRYIEADRDYRILDYAPGVELYHVPNPLNDLFTFSIMIETGTEHDEHLGLAASLLGVAGTADHEPEALQQHWYRLGSNFNISAGANTTTISISGLDDQFANSLALMLQLVRSPVSDEQTLEELKARILRAREDRREDPAAISQALFLYNRYGEDSPLLTGLSSADIVSAQLDELLGLIPGLLDYEHTLTYTGSLTPAEVTQILHAHHVPSEALRSPAPYRFQHAQVIDDNRIYVLHRETAQAQVRIEFPDGSVDEALTVPSSLFNNYFGVGMSSVVFQEMREARALAYSASARYAQGGRLGEENIVLGAIGTQNDKAVEALEYFMTLFDNLPVSGERFEETRESLINRYRTNTLGFRQIPGTVRSWQRLGLDTDPRPERFRQLQDSDLQVVTGFHSKHIANRPRLISVVGNLDRMNREALARLGVITEIQIDDIFAD